MKKSNKLQKETEAYKEIHKIIHCLDGLPEDLPQFVLKKRLRGCTGLCDFDSITLAIFKDIVPTLIHELVHYINPEYTETKVIKIENMIKHHIKMKDLIHILKSFINLL